MSRLKVELKGFKALGDKLRSLKKPSALRRITRAATGAGATVQRKAYVKEWKQITKESERGSTGFGAKSIKTKTKPTKNGAGYYAITGIDKDAVLPLPEPTQRKRKRKRNRPRVYRPYKTEHLMNFGFQHKGGKTVPGKMPRAKAYAASEAEAQAAYEARVVKQLNTELVKAR